MNFKGTKEKLLNLSNSPSDSDIQPTIYTEKINYKVDDFNFDNINDIAIETMSGYSGVNLYYDIYFAENNQYIRSDITLSNYEIIPKYQIVLSEYKSGARHFTDIYEINEEQHLSRFVTYEKYEDDDLCFITEIYRISRVANKKYPKIASCDALIRMHTIKSVFASVIKEKSLLYDKINSKSPNGMYLIKNDTVEILDGSAEKQKVLIRFKGKQLISKYINKKDLQKIPPESYIHKHKTHFINEMTDVYDTLTLQKIDNKFYNFDLWTMGNSGNMCEVEGIAKQKSDKLVAILENNCVIEFYPTSIGIRTETENSKCRDYYCGHNAFIGDINFEVFVR